MKVLIWTLFLSAFLTGNCGINPKQPLTMSEKFEQLKELSSRKSVIRMNGNRFKELVRTGPRNYSIVLMLTAMSPQRQCSVCRAVYDEFTVAAQSWQMQKHSSDSGLFFGVVDFDDGYDIFTLLRINTAPVIMHFPPKGKPKAADTLDVQRNGYQAETMVRWIIERTNYEFRVIRSASYGMTLLIAVMMGLGSAVIYLKQDNTVFKNRKMWAFLAVFFCLMMTSGQMWNHIRGAPFYQRASANQISYIHPSSQGQYAAETFIILALNTALVFSVIGLIEMNGGVSGIEGTPAFPVTTYSYGKDVISMVLVGVITVLFSAILRIFKNKSGGYPYRGLF